MHRGVEVPRPRLPTTSTTDYYTGKATKTIVKVIDFVDYCRRSCYITSIDKTVK